MADLKVLLQQYKVFNELKKHHTVGRDAAEVSDLQKADNIVNAVKALLGNPTDNDIVPNAFLAAQTRIQSKSNSWDAASDFFPDLREGLVEQIADSLTGDDKGKLSAILDKLPNDKKEENIVKLAQKVVAEIDAKKKSILIADFITANITDQTATDGDAKALLAKLKPADPPPAKLDPKAITVSGKIKAGETGKIEIKQEQWDSIIKEDGLKKSGDEKTKDKIKFKLLEENNKKYLLITPEADLDTKQIKVKLGDSDITIDVEKKPAEEPGKGNWFTNYWKLWVGGVALLGTLFGASKAEDNGYTVPIVGGLITLVLGAWHWNFFQGESKDTPAPAPSATGAAK